MNGTRRGSCCRLCIVKSEAWPPLVALSARDCTHVGRGFRSHVLHGKVQGLRGPYQNFPCLRKFLGALGAYGSQCASEFPKRWAPKRKLPGWCPRVNNLAARCGVHGVRTLIRPGTHPGTLKLLARRRTRRRARKIAVFHRPWAKNQSGSQQV